MTTAQKIQKYMPQLQEIAAYAQAANIDMTKTSLDELFDRWYAHSQGILHELLENKTPRAQAFRQQVFEEAERRIKNN